MTLLGIPYINIFLKPAHVVYIICFVILITFKVSIRNLLKFTLLIFIFIAVTKVSGMHSLSDALADATYFLLSYIFILHVVEEIKEGRAKRGTSEL